MARPSSREDEGEDEPMLHEKRAPPGTRSRGTAFCACLSLFLFISFVCLAGVMLSPFFADYPPRPTSTPVQEPAQGTVQEPVPEPPKNDPAPSATPVPTIKAASPSEQLDLKTSFEVSSTPTVRDYVFNVTLGRGDPDGYAKPLIFVNGQSPGPLIEANTGDLIRIVVNNQLPEEGTTIHWHGIDQRNSNWMDGVHGVTQCAIPPGQSFTYGFNVTGQRGTFWYHSHDSVQYTNGLYGPLIIHDPDEKIPQVDDDKIVMFGDIFRRDAEEVTYRPCRLGLSIITNQAAACRRLLETRRRRRWS